MKGDQHVIHTRVRGLADAEGAPVPGDYVVIDPPTQAMPEGHMRHVSVGGDGSVTVVDGASSRTYGNAGEPSFGRGAEFYRVEPPVEAPPPGGGAEPTPTAGSSE